MPTDVEQLKNDFLSHLNFFVFPSTETLVEKIKPLQGIKLKKIKLQSELEKKLSITNKDKSISIALDKKDLGIYGFSINDFKKSIEAVKNNDNSKKFLSQAIEEIIDSHNEKLCQIHLSSAVLTYTELYEKFKHAHSKENDSNEIHTLILENCIKAISPADPNSNRLFYNLITFINAYQYQDLNFNDFLKSINNYQDDGTCENIFNTIKSIQLTSYRETYIKLIQSIEELAELQVKDKSATNNLITKLKETTTVYFRYLIQADFYDKQVKYIHEKDITKKLRNECIQLIKDYRNENIEEFKKQKSIFLKILWFIVNLIPTSMVSHSKKMMLFFKKEENYNKRTSEVTLQLDQLASLNFFRRY